MRITPEQSGVTIVLVGQFNPAIFRPEWFRSRELAATDDLARTEVDIIHPEVARFRLPWATIHVQREQFVVSTTEDPFVRIHDLVLKIFVENLRHTPVFHIGINREAHFRLSGRAAIDKIGYALAPPTAWGEWAGDITSGDENNHGGLRSLTMEQSRVDDRRAGYIRASVQPSVMYVPGIWMQINDHYEVADKSTPPDGSAEIMKVLEESFDRSVSRSEWIMDQILRLA